MIKEYGQSLIEIVFAIGVIALVLTAIVSLSVRSVNVTSQSANQTRANRYAEEAIEWFRVTRDSNVNNFFTHAGDYSTKRTACYMNFPPVDNWDANPGACSPSEVIPNTPFLREVDMQYTSAASRLDITVRVKWDNSTVEHRSSLTDPRAR